MYQYDEYEENELTSQDVNDIYAEQSFCFRTRGGRVCRDPRRGIECFYPRFGGRPFCNRFRRF
jgi:hypothetical protein